MNTIHPEFFKERQYERTELDRSVEQGHRPYPEEGGNAVVDEMENSLMNGNRVAIRGLCSVFVKQNDGYTGRNPKSGALMEVKSKKLPFFKYGKELKEGVNIS